MGGCVITFTVRYKDGSLATMNLVEVFEVVRVMWWETDRFVTSKGTGVTGIVSFDLDKGKKYHFVFSAPGKKAHYWRTLDYCPIYMGMKYPY